MSTILEYTPLATIEQYHADLQRTFKSNKCRPESYRRTQLLQLAYMIQENEARMIDAFYKDLGRPKEEVTFIETHIMIGACVYAIKNLRKWMKTEYAPMDMVTGILTPRITKDPKGVGLIIGPFNYPIYCTVSPLMGAIAAGCPCVIKMSEIVPNISALFEELVAKYLDNDAYRVVNGGVQETTKLLELKWDQIFFTGSGRVGKIVATAAAQHLTPVSLELGGKSPVIVDSTANIDVAARKILWGKTVNGGQTCVAPDYVLVSEDCADRLVEAFKKTYAKFYPEGAGKSASFGRIVDHRSFDRLKDIMDRSKAELLCGGESDRDTKFIAPSIYVNVSKEDALMESELFGPILPIVTVKNVQEAVEYVRQGPSPLVIYVFTTDGKTKEYIRTWTRSGGLMVNDVIIQAASDPVPFGGTGDSGYGAHHGRAAFDTFTHHRTMMEAPRIAELFMALRYPPYTAKNYVRLRLFAKVNIPWAKPGSKLSLLQRLWIKIFGAGVIVMLAAAVAQRLK
ncbi:aldehyde dehydrogenase [Dacryopinax primogenitus]|uniref:Aldehyde dehydrogenase n=1 Tax=Dacryopinax primogenitus (strain DJM 731) TaxID=1858805 RepID=M5G1E3_DACPD|nr:aldehyde dehydrogenase [Dacryopinax primogenitus]EJT97582.1 aldehyde dehydrogenase [Dacryopinax primogenitus]